MPVISSSFKSVRLYVYGTVSFILLIINISLLQLGVYPLANIFFNLDILNLSLTLNLALFSLCSSICTLLSSLTSFGFILILLCQVLLYLLTASSKTSCYTFLLVAVICLYNLFFNVLINFSATTDLPLL